MQKCGLLCDRQLQILNTVSLDLSGFESVFTARCTIVQSAAAVLRLHVVRLPVRL